VFDNSSSFLRAATYGAHVNVFYDDQDGSVIRTFPLISGKFVWRQTESAPTFSRLPVQQIGRKHMCSFWRMWSQTSLNYIAIVSYLLY